MTFHRVPCVCACEAFECAFPFTPEGLEACRQTCPDDYRIDWSCTATRFPLGPGDPGGPAPGWTLTVTPVPVQLTRAFQIGQFICEWDRSGAGTTVPPVDNLAGSAVQVYTDATPSKTFDVYVGGTNDPELVYWFLSCYTEFAPFGACPNNPAFFPSWTLGMAFGLYELPVTEPPTAGRCDETSDGCISASMYWNLASQQCATGPPAGYCLEPAVYVGPDIGSEAADTVDFSMTLVPL